MGFYFHRSTLHFVDDAGESTELESHEVRTETRPRSGFGEKPPSQYLHEGVDKEKYLKLFSDFTPFMILNERDCEITEARIKEVSDRTIYPPEMIEYISVLMSTVSHYRRLQES